MKAVEWNSEEVAIGLALMLEAEKASASIGGAGGVSSLAMIGGGGGVGAMMSEAERQAVVQDKIAKTNERTAIATEAIAKALAQGGNGKEPITATYI